MGYLSVIILSKTKSNWSFVVKNIKIKRKATAMKHFLSNYNIWICHIMKYWLDIKVLELSLHSKNWIMTVSKLISSSARRCRAYATVGIYKYYFFRQRDRERERERERERWWWWSSSSCRTLSEQWGFFSVPHVAARIRTPNLPHARLTL